ncbi:hypothetical protein JCM5350_005895 [Sporobolomyces pararoseus]
MPGTKRPRQDDGEDPPPLKSFEFMKDHEFDSEVIPEGPLRKVFAYKNKFSNWSAKKINELFRITFLVDRKATLDVVYNGFRVSEGVLEALEDWERILGRACEWSTFETKRLYLSNAYGESPLWQDIRKVTKVLDDSVLSGFYWTIVGVSASWHGGIEEDHWRSKGGVASKRNAKKRRDDYFKRDDSIYRETTNDRPHGANSTRDRSKVAAMCLLFFDPDLSSDKTLSNTSSINGKEKKKKTKILSNKKIDELYALEAVTTKSWKTSKMATPLDLQWAHPRLYPGQIELGGRGGGDGSRHKERKKHRKDQRTSKEFKDDRRKGEMYKLFKRLIKGTDIVYIEQAGSQDAQINLVVPEGSTPFIQSIKSTDSVFPIDVKQDSRLGNGALGKIQFKWKDEPAFAIVFKGKSGDEVSRSFRINSPKRSFFYQTSIDSLTRLYREIEEMREEEI